MRYLSRYALDRAAFLLVLASCSDPSPGQRPGVSAAPLNQSLRRITVLEQGQNPDQVTLRHGDEEVAPWGPTAAAMAPDGTIAVADPLAARIVRIGSDGKDLEPLPAPHVDHLVYTPEGDLAYWSRVRSQVHVLSSTGEQLSQVEIPHTMRWVGGLRLDASGSINLETGYQESALLASRRLPAALVEGVPGVDGLHYRALRDGARAELQVLRAKPDPEGRAVVLSRFDVAVPPVDGSVAFVGATADGDVYVVVHDLVRASPVAIERRIRRYSPAGELLAEVEPPRGVFAPPHSLSLTPEGEVLILRPVTTGVELWIWSGQGGAS